jgi:hypothetical protein
MANLDKSPALKVETPNAVNPDSFIVSVDFFGKLAEKQAKETAKFKEGLNDLGSDDLRKLKAKIAVERANLEKPTPTGMPEQSAIEAIVSPQQKPKDDRFKLNRKAAFAEFEAAVDAKIAEKKAADVMRVEELAAAQNNALRKEVEKNKPKTEVAQTQVEKPTASELQKIRTKTQNQKAAEILEKKETIHTVEKGDTLGAIVKGLTGKLDYSMPVDYQSDKLKKKPTKLAEASLIYPRQFVWVEKRNGKDVVVIADKQEEETHDEVPPRTTSDSNSLDSGESVTAEPAPKFTAESQPDSAKVEPASPLAISPKPEVPAAKSKPEPESKPVWLGVESHEEGLTQPNPASVEGQLPAWTKK